MAINTRHFLVPAEKSILRVPVMAKERFRPGGAAMAGVTLIAVMAIVLVIFEMAGRAGCFHLVLKGTLSVTIAARQLGVAV